MFILFLYNIVLFFKKIGKEAMTVRKVIFLYKNIKRFVYFPAQKYGHKLWLGITKNVYLQIEKKSTKQN